MNSSNTETVAGITYSKPEVILLQETGIGTSEIAARTCYDSFDSSESSSIQTLNEKFDELLTEPTAMNEVLENINEVDHSDLLDKLAWTHFHYSIMEHANLTYLIKGTSRGVLQEHARHRMQSISVRSTRYTMQSVLHAFNTCMIASKPNQKDTFNDLIRPMNLFAVQGITATIEINALYEKFHYQLIAIGKEEFISLTMSKSAQEVYANHTLFESSLDLFSALNSCKSKRNVGDAVKWVVTDNWKVDLVITFNLRSLKNYFQLRDSNAAFFQIQWLAEAMKEVTPSKYLNLIIKDK